MEDRDLAIIKGLVSVAWADGKIAEQEMEVIHALLEAFAATPSERREVLFYAKNPKTLDDVPLADLDSDDRRLLLHHAVVVAWSDGEFPDSEKKLIEALCERMGIPALESKAVIMQANDYAQQNLSVLRSG